MIIVSCPTKFHAFNLAEQIDKHKLLKHFYTVYHSVQNKFIAGFNKRVDKEIINIDKIITFPYLAPLFRLPVSAFLTNDLFDKLVSFRIQKEKDYRIFIGWSGMSLNTINKVKDMGKIAILERGSSHILYQYEILKEEYKIFNVELEIDERLIEKELKEYSLADYISVPSEFVKKSFIIKGIPENKIIKNNYGSNFSSNYKSIKSDNHPFRILYLGNLTIQKGLIYLFEALDKLDNNNFEFWIIGSIDKNINKILHNYKKDNWKLFGFIDHYALPEYIQQCDVAVQPSLQEGLSMVIPQILKSGIPVIATVNTGGEDIIIDNKNGFIVPIRDPIAIKNKLEILMNDRKLLMQMKENAALASKDSLSWVKYGDRYIEFLKLIS